MEAVVPVISSRFAQIEKMIKVGAQVADIDSRISYNNKIRNVMSVPVTLLTVFVKDMFAKTNQHFYELNLPSYKIGMAQINFVTSLWLTRPFAAALQDDAHIAATIVELQQVTHEAREFNPMTLSGMTLVYDTVKERFPSEDADVLELLNIECRKLVIRENISQSHHDCAICCKKLRRVCIRLECGHGFHHKCLADWCSYDKDTCPTCRVTIDASSFASIFPDAVKAYVARVHTT